MGILLVCLLLLLFYFSMMMFRSRRMRLALTGVLIAGALARIFCSLDPMLHSWDERYHALVAKNLTVSPFTPKLYPEPILEYTYENWTANHIWLHKQPLALWGISASLKLFGNNVFAVRIPSILLSTLSILLVFLVGRIMYNEKIGLIAAFFCSINGFLIERAAGRGATDHIDTFFLFFVLGSILFVVLHFSSGMRKHLLFSGLMTGFALLTKWLAGLLVIPLYIVLNWRKKTISDLIVEVLIISIPAALIAAPWQLYTAKHFPKEFAWEQKMNLFHFISSIEGHNHPWWYYFDVVRISVNELIYIVFFWFLLFAFKSKIKVQNRMLILWAIIPFVIFSFAQTKMPGYLIIAFPAFFIMIAFFIDYCWKQYISVVQKWLRWVYIGTISLILILAFRYSIERIKPFQHHNLAYEAKMEIEQLNFSDSSIVFNVACPIEMMFHSNVIAYQGIPDDFQIEKLLAENYRLYLLDEGVNLEFQLTHPRIKVIRLPSFSSFCSSK